ncbi:30S ribosomal protein S3 [Candidatus Annandia adelgestsuga]|uniref:Small ribosomal subunit protein uS3 n=1 Tax=Candidatus Annandia adelgestsuga TaxID=1302411 RepID=A0A3Q9CKP9_9ENTR|nr:30S ribosomal protein S3 [Candidatus Annandia adelgestsuga]AZP36216.1 30S ribosomal protein S3 [Candidatus Annandia adelgestsuga]
MGQKVNANGMRLGIIKNHNSFWFSNKKEFANNINCDFKIREFLKKKLFKLSISKIIIERIKEKANINIYAYKINLIKNKNNKKLKSIEKKLSKIINIEVKINIIEIKIPELDSKIVANEIVFQLEKRFSFRRSIKKSIQNAMRLGAQGIKIEISGRLGGAEIARTEWYREGRVPLHTLRAYIDYNNSEAQTNYGKIGVKVWIFKGEILDKLINMKKINYFIKNNK